MNLNVANPNQFKLYTEIYILPLIFKVSIRGPLHEQRYRISEFKLERPAGGGRADVNTLLPLLA